MCEGEHACAIAWGECGGMAMYWCVCVCVCAVQKIATNTCKGESLTGFGFDHLFSASWHCITKETRHFWKLWSISHGSTANWIMRLARNILHLGMQLPICLFSVKGIGRAKLLNDAMETFCWLGKITLRLTNCMEMSAPADGWAKTFGQLKTDWSWFWSWPSPGTGPDHDSVSGTGGHLSGRSCKLLVIYALTVCGACLGLLFMSFVSVSSLERKQM